VAFAGGAITILMLLALTVAAGTLLLSAVIGVIVVAAISVLATLLAAPAALTLWGRHIRRHGAEHELAATAPGGSWAARLGRSVPVVAVSLAALLGVGVQALSLATGPPDARQLPAGSSAARDYAALSRHVGAGWVTPFELLIVAHGGAITTLPRLDALAAAQRTIARYADVAAVVGPAELAKRAAPLAHAEGEVAAGNRNLKQSAQVIGGLNSDLGQAASGAEGVQSGFAQATAAVQKLAGGGSSGDAVGALRTGLERAAAGSQQIDSGLGQAAGAAGRIAGGGASIAAGANRLVASLRSDSAATGAAGPRLNALARQMTGEASILSRLGGSVAALDDSSQSSAASAASTKLSDAESQLGHLRALGLLSSHYRALAADVQAAQQDLAGAQSSNAASAAALASQIAAAASGERAAGGALGTLAGAAERLSASADQLQQSAGSLPSRIATLQSGQRALAGGIERLAASEAAMTHGLGALSGGTAALSARLAALENGAAQVASGLSGEQRKAAALTSALASGTRSASGKTPTSPPILGTLARNPGFFGSGYLVLAALEGSAAAKKAGIDFIVNIARNGQSARMLVVPRSGLRSAATGRLRQRLEAIAARLAASTDSSVYVGGPAAQMRDYAAAAARRVPLLVGVLMLATFLLLVVVFRSLFAPLVGVLLNLLSVAAAFGLLSLLSGGRHPLIGGPGYVDSLSVNAMFAVVFALSLDYQVFLLMRMREGWQRTGSTTQGVDYGVARTARVVAGAAAIMAGVFLAFASADVATIRQLGVGLAAAILIDATLVRLILLPCALRLGGRLTWWLPRWLDRALPAIDIGAERRDPGRSREEAIGSADPGREPIGRAAGAGAADVPMLPV
jgi:RND superfamily putative drug exporter